MKRLLKNKPALILAALLAIVLIVLAVVLVLYARQWILTVAIALAALLALWLLIELFLRVWKKRKQKTLDEAIVAKEGIEDRKREWASWMAELDRQEIDRYKLPFYLLVGEPQSGKSILLHNSELHFPFGKQRLSGAGGTRGCDWWFTDTAVILDLAGRLFTHEGGVADDLEWQAFLDLLVDYRPLCPANGILLVLPCDALLQDQREAVLHKTERIKHSLLTLSNKLQAHLPVYVVLTKADKVFGFAECVHKLDTPQRQQMFGWSRAGDKVDAPFELAEAQAGFESMVGRSRLLAYEMMATARLPEATPEVDRLYAFPEEMRGLWPNLKVYLESLFTESTLVDKLLFRGFYLTSGLQSGAPIAKVCARLLGESGAADARALEGLFTKQRAYFIRDLVHERVFGERGLVRPTSRRVARARTLSRIGYGFAAALAVTAIGVSAHYATTTKHEYTFEGDGDGQKWNSKADHDALTGIAELSADSDLATTCSKLDALQEALARKPDHLVAEATGRRPAALKELYGAVVDKLVFPRLRRTAAIGLTNELKRFRGDYKALTVACDDARKLCGEIDYSSADTRKSVLLRACAEDPDLNKRLETAIVRRQACPGNTPDAAPADSTRPDYLRDLLDVAASRLDECLQSGHTWNPTGQLGFVLSSQGLKTSYGALSKLQTDDSQAEKVDELARQYSASLKVLRECRNSELGTKLRRETINNQVNDIEGFRSRFVRDFGLERTPDRSPARDGLERTLDQYFKEKAEVAVPERFDDEDEVLGRICDPDFLPVGKWNLAQIVTDLEGRTRDLGVGGTRGAHFKDSIAVLRAKCKRRGSEFCQAFPKWSALHDEVQGLIDENLIDSIDIALVGELVGLAKQLKAVDGLGAPANTAWIGCIGKLLAEHLNAARGQGAGLDDERQVSLLACLSSVASLGGEGGRAATNKLSQYVGTLQDECIRSWEESARRPIKTDDGSDNLCSQIAERDAAFGRLRTLRQLVRSANLPQETNDNHVKWLKRADVVLASLIEPGLKRLTIDWTKFDLPAASSVSASARELSEQLQAPQIEERVRRSTQCVGDVDDSELPDDMPATKKAVSSLRKLIGGNDAQSIANLPIVRAVRAELDKFAHSSQLDSNGAALAQAIVTSRAKLAPQFDEAPASNQGTSMAGAAWDQFVERAALAIGAQYMDELRVGLEKDGQLLVLALCSNDPHRWGEFATNGDTFRQQTMLVLEPNSGLLDRLAAKYGRNQAQPLVLPSELEVDSEQLEWWALDELLRDVQHFLLGPAKTLNDAQLKITIKRDTNCDNCLWKQGRLACFYNNGSKDNRPERLSSSGTPLTFTWTFRTANVLLWRWCEEADPTRAANVISSPIQSPLAPLLLAWTANAPEADGTWHVDLAVQAGNDRHAPAWLSFDDRRLPERKSNLPRH